MTINTHPYLAAAALAVASPFCVWTGRGARRSNDVEALARRHAS